MINDNETTLDVSGIEELFSDIKKKNIDPDMTIYMDTEKNGDKPLSLADGIAREKEDTKASDEEELTLTKLSASNIKSFSDLIPEDIAERISLPGVYGIGILTAGDRGRLFPMGILLYSTNLQFESYITIEWLFVRESLRRRGYGQKLMEAFCDQAYALSVESISCDLPATKDSHEAVDFLSALGFSFTLQIPYAMEFSLSDMKKHELFTKEIKNAGLRRIKDIPDDEIKKALQVTFGRMNGDARQFMQTDLSWYDEEISTAVVYGKKPIAFLLIHRCPSGKLQLLYMRGTSQASAKDFASLVRLSAALIEKTYGQESRIEIVFRSENGLKLFDNMYFGHRVRLCIRAGIPC